MRKPEKFYCKHCDTTFARHIQEFESRALLIECPACHWLHPRQFEAGVAIHCDINKMIDPTVLR